MSIISSIALVVSRLKDVLPKTEDCHEKPQLGSNANGEAQRLVSMSTYLLEDQTHLE